MAQCKKFTGVDKIASTWRCFHIDFTFITDDRSHKVRQRNFTCVLRREHVWVPTTMTLTTGALLEILKSVRKESGCKSYRTYILFLYFGNQLQYLRYI